jgi:hypothetical protein
MRMVIVKRIGAHLHYFHAHKYRLLPFALHSLLQFIQIRSIKRVCNECSSCASRISFRRTNVQLARTSLILAEPREFNVHNACFICVGRADECIYGCDLVALVSMHAQLVSALRR